MDEIFIDESMKESYKISDDSGAEWALKKIREYEDEAQKWAEFYAGQAAREQAKAAQKIEYFKNLLVEYFETVPHKTTKTGIEKYVLPSGELILKPPAIDYTRDDDALVAWCKINHPEFVKTKQTPIWTEVKKLITTTGEIPDGVVPIETAAKFDVKVAQ